MDGKNTNLRGYQSSTQVKRRRFWYKLRNMNIARSETEWPEVEIGTDNASSAVAFDEINRTKSMVGCGSAANSLIPLEEVETVTYSKSSQSEISSGNDEAVHAASDEEFNLSVIDFYGSNISSETSWILFLQILLPFITAGIGMVFAGLVLDVVQHWNLFIQVPETFILVPALLGLKGNLEMTFASRLSTLTNMGRMDSNESRWIVITANLSLIQVQAIVVAFLASAFAIVLAWIPKGQIDWSHAALLCASSLTTASMASLILSIVMISVVLCSRHFGINPDNVATPIAASLGDLTTLGILSLLGSVFLQAHLVESWLNVGVILMFMTAAPFWAYLARKDEGSTDVLENGWSPIIISMLISGMGGFILEGAIRKFPKIAVFQPVINGVGGNLAAIQASRLATFYHQNNFLGCLGENKLCDYFSFRRAFFSRNKDARSARVLLFLVVPCHIFFNWVIHTYHEGNSPPSDLLFTSVYITAAFLQVLLLLYVCQLLTAILWSLQVDPDCAVIPYLTALGDLCGTFLLYLIFIFYSWLCRDINSG